MLVGFLKEILKRIQNINLISFFENLEFFFLHMVHLLSDFLQICTNNFGLKKINVKCKNTFNFLQCFIKFDELKV